MDYNDFKEFFKVYVKQYGPYQNSKMFQSFSNFLMNSYYNDSYSNIPSSFKSAFEQQVLDSEYVVPFLLSLGIPLSEIDKISNSDRFKIINTISDFHRYKGTVSLIDNLVANFDVNDNMAIYELYLDMTIDINDTKVWEVLPKLIKAGTGFRPSLELNTALPFSTLNAAPNWFIDEVTLSDLYDAGELELPYKTNCILLDSTILNKIEPIIQIVSALVLETLKNTNIQLFFSDGVYLTTFSNMNLIWYYVFHKLHSSGNTSIPNLDKNMMIGRKLFSRYEIPNLDGSLPRGGSSSLFASLTNIQTLIDEYTNLSTSNSDSGLKINEFYDLYIDAFPSFNFSKTMTFAEYRIVVMSIVGNELLSYIDNRIDSAINPTNEANLIASEIYSSILSYKSIAISTSSSMNMDYLDYYFLNLPGLIKDIKNSTTYIMLNLLKPYHTDLLDNRNQRVVADSKFNNALVSYTKLFGTLYSSLSDQITSEQITLSSTTASTDHGMVLQSALFNIIYQSLANTAAVPISHSDLFKLSMMGADINTISNFLKNIISTTPTDNIQITDVWMDIVNTTARDSELLLSNILNNVLSGGISGLSISDELKILSSTWFGSDPLPILNSLIQSMNHFERTISGMNDVSFANPRVSKISGSSPDDSAILLGIFRDYDNLPVMDIATSYIYDNPITGVHIVYTN